MSTEERDELIKLGRELAHPNWCLSVPFVAKGAINNLIAALEAATPRTTTTEWGVAYPDSNSVDYIGTALHAESAFDEEEDAHENVQLVCREVTAWDVVRTSTVDADEDLEAGGPNE